MGPLKTLTPTPENPYPWRGYGFLPGRVRVAVKYPRVTRDNAYHHPSKTSNLQAVPADPGLQHGQNT